MGKMNEDGTLTNDWLRAIASRTVLLGGTLGQMVCLKKMALELLAIRSDAKLGALVRRMPFRPQSCELSTSQDGKWRIMLVKPLALPPDTGFPWTLFKVCDTPEEALNLMLEELKISEEQAAYEVPTAPDILPKSHPQVTLESNTNKGARILHAQGEQS